jgi:hypothetical protein
MLPGNVSYGRSSSDFCRLRVDEIADVRAIVFQDRSKPPADLLKPHANYWASKIVNNEIRNDHEIG